jgi:transitional endoplasmic reticulum ATPase
MVHKKTNPDKLDVLPRLKVARLEPSRSGRSLCYVDQQILDDLKLSTGDIIELIGKERTAGIAVSSFADKGKNIIRIDDALRLNLGSTIGEFVTIRPTLASPAKEIELAPTKEISDIKKQLDIIKGKLIDKPIMTGDIIDIPGAFIKGSVDNNPMNGFMRMLEVGGESRRPNLGPLRLIVLNTKPNDEVVRFTRNTRVKLHKKVIFLNKVGKLMTSEDIGGLEKQISEIKELIELNFNRPTITEKYNIDPLKGILLVGPSGIGKTLLAKVIANETEYTFISILPSDIMHKYQGESENSLQKLFQTAEAKAPSIIFIDHIDSVAPMIQIELLENARFLEHRIVTQLMALMDGINTYEKVIVLATTHKLELIEPALLRPGRFTKIIHLQLPDLNGRAKIYHIHTRNIPLSDDISLMEIAKLSEDFTGADIKGVCQLAVINAVKREMPDFYTNVITGPEDLEVSIKVEKRDFLKAIEEITERLKK